MISKSLIKLIHALQKKKQRQEQQLFLVEGHKSLFEFINNGYHASHVFVVQENAKLQSTLQNHSMLSVKPNLVTAKEMARISSLKQPTDCLGIFHIKNHAIEAADLKAKLCIGLDFIQDPGNLGSIIRTLDWYGIQTLYCSEDCVDVYNPKVVQATMGSLSRVKVIYTDLPRLKESFEKHHFLAATMDGLSVRKFQPEKPVFLMMGNEGNGVRETLRAVCDGALSVPAFGRAESLNVAIATAILVDRLV